MKWLGQTILIVCLPSLVFHLEKVVYCWNCNCQYLTPCREGFPTFSKGVWFFPFKIETAQLNSIILSGQKYLLDSIGRSSFYFLHLYSLFMSVYNLQGAMSVDSITDLDDNQSRLLEALQLSLPAEAQNNRGSAHRWRWGDGLSDRSWGLRLRDSTLVLGHVMKACDVLQVVTKWLQLWGLAEEKREMFTWTKKQAKSHTPEDQNKKSI